LAAVFFFAATLIAGSTWCPMRAMAAPSAGVADACEAKVNETTDAATRANKVIFICFLLDDLCGRPNTGVPVRLEIARLSPSAISVVDAGGASVASRATFDTGVIRFSAKKNSFAAPSGPEEQGYLWASGGLS
jgi:hypothetical protein